MSLNYHYICAYYMVVNYKKNVTKQSLCMHVLYADTFYTFNIHASLALISRLMYLSLCKMVQNIAQKELSVNIRTFFINTQHTSHTIFPKLHT